MCSMCVRWVILKNKIGGGLYICGGVGVLRHFLDMLTLVGIDIGF